MRIDPFLAVSAALWLLAPSAGAQVPTGPAATGPAATGPRGPASSAQVPSAAAGAPAALPSPPPSASPPVWSSQPPPMRPAPVGPQPPPFAAPVAEIPPPQGPLPAVNPSAGYAMPPPLMPAPLRHGAYLRVALGGGGGRIAETVSGTSLSDTITGGGVGVDVAVGGALSPVFTIGGQFAFQQLSKPTLKLSNGTELKANNDVSIALLGAVFEGYATATSGFHFSGTLGAARLSISDSRGDTIDSTGGVGYALGIGYDFAVSKTWYVGVAARYIGAHTSADDSKQDARSFSVMVDALNF